MALKKQTIIKGFTAEYWKITQIISDHIRKECFVTLALYKDRETRFGDILAIIDSKQVDITKYFYRKISRNENIVESILRVSYRCLTEMAENGDLEILANAENV